jgi:hypothetical protein
MQRLPQQRQNKISLPRNIRGIGTDFKAKIIMKNYLRGESSKLRRPHSPRAPLLAAAKTQELVLLFLSGAQEVGV